MARHILKILLFVLVAELCASAVKLSRINDYCRAHDFAGLGWDAQGFYCRAKPPSDVAGEDHGQGKAGGN